MITKHAVLSRRASRGASWKVMPWCRRGVLLEP
ncbi:hypothetical protein BJ962_003367, partial [Streptomyces aureorectus]|nr:hypothetical protein [Streptomyces calvus]